MKRGSRIHLSLKMTQVQAKPQRIQVPLLGLEVSAREARGNIEMPEGSEPCLVPVVRVGLSPPQPPIKAVLGKVSQHRHRDRLLQSTVAAEKAAKLVHQVSQHTWHTTRVYRRYTQGTCTQTHGRPTPSTQAVRHTPLQSCSWLEPIPSITHTQEHTLLP